MPTLVEDILRLTGIDVRPCGRCEGCGARFTLKDGLDLSPTELVRRVLADDRAAVFRSRALWLLSGDQARRVVCEHGVDFAGFLAALRKLALQSGTAPAEPRVAHLMQTFTDQIRSFGRAHHRALLKEMRLGVRDAVTEPMQEFAMVCKGKLRLFAPRVRDVARVRKALDAGKTAEDSP